MGKEIMTSVTGNIRHDFPAGVVAARVAKDIADLEASHARCSTGMEDVRRRYAETPWKGRPPSSQEELDRIHHDMVARQRDHYSTARVIERSPRDFLLVYGDVADGDAAAGTGPFPTLEQAQSWFLNGGR